MTDPTDSLPWMRAWQDALRQLQAQASGKPDDGQAALQRLNAFGGDYVGMAGDWWRMLGAPAAAAGGARAPTPADFESMRADLSARYQQMLMPAWAQAAALQPPQPAIGAAHGRWQLALQRAGQQAATIAHDAYQRFCTALASSDAALPPITRLRELHELWIECGEAAYAEAAHREAFADAQAELLAAFVELCAEQQRPAR
ncbi:MAG: poly(R)-hydroxyalkanoic acid synthase subunit PhaE [Steroidobacteraceae bacterium]